MTREQLTAWTDAAALEGQVWQTTPSPTGWGHSSYDDDRRAWWTNTGGLTYRRALIARACAIADRALLARFGRDDIGAPAAEIDPDQCDTVADVRREYVWQWNRAAADSDQSPL